MIQLNDVIDELEKLKILCNKTIEIDERVITLIIAWNFYGIII